VIFFPNTVGVTQFTVVVQGRQVTFSGVPDTNCPGMPNSDCIDQDFAVFVYNAGTSISLAAPTNLVATVVTSTSVALTWSPVLGADHYEISRRTSGGYIVIDNTTTAASFTDSSASSGTAYLYRVRALDPANNPGAYSNADLATTVVFTDDPLTAGSTIVLAQHMYELRQAVNAVRSTAGLGSATFTDDPLIGIAVKAVHVQELRSNLDAARSTLGLGALTYSDDPIAGGQTIVKAAHVAELRAGVR